VYEVEQMKVILREQMSANRIIQSCPNTLMSWNRRDH